jgi:hypothetical protein
MSPRKSWRSVVTVTLFVALTSSGAAYARPLNPVAHSRAAAGASDRPVLEAIESWLSVVWGDLAAALGRPAGLSSSHAVAGDTVCTGCGGTNDAGWGIDPNGNQTPPPPPPGG